MKKRLMFILAMVFFLVFLVLLGLSGRPGKPVSDTSLLNENAPSPTFQPESIPGPPETEIENELRMIETDLKKMKEDTRFTPPSFVFKLGITPE